MKYIVLIIAIVAVVFWFKNDDKLHSPAIGSNSGQGSTYLKGSHTGSNTIVLYTTSWCGYCKKAKQLLKNNKVRYVEYDIEKDSAARQRYQRLGGRGVPLIVANNTVIRGYSESKLRELASNSRYKL